MRSAILFVAACLCSSAFAQEAARNLKWEYAYVDTGESCDPRYSLYPLSVKCIKGTLYSVRYRISYVFHEQKRVVYLDYIPEKDAPLDANGNLIPRDHNIQRSD